MSDDETDAPRGALSYATRLEALESRVQGLHDVVFGHRADIRPPLPGDCTKPPLPDPEEFTVVHMMGGAMGGAPDTRYWGVGRGPANSIDVVARTPDREVAERLARLLNADAPRAVAPEPEAPRGPNSKYFAGESSVRGSVGCHVYYGSAGDFAHVARCSDRARAEQVACLLNLESPATTAAACVTCDECAFTYGAEHGNADNSYSCPLCEANALSVAVGRLRRGARERLGPERGDWSAESLVAEVLERLDSLKAERDDAFSALADRTGDREAVGGLRRALSERYGVSEVAQLGPVGLVTEVVHQLDAARATARAKDRSIAQLADALRDLTTTDAAVAG